MKDERGPDRRQESQYGPRDRGRAQVADIGGAEEHPVQREDHPGHRLQENEEPPGVRYLAKDLGICGEHAGQHGVQRGHDHPGDRAERQCVPGDPPGQPARPTAVAAAQRRAHQCLGRDRQRVQDQLQERPQLENDLVRAHRGRRGARGDDGGGQETRLEGQAPQHQVPAEAELPADHRGTRAQRYPFSGQRVNEESGHDELRQHIGRRRPLDAPAGAEHENRQEQRGQSVARQHVVQRAAGVVHPAHPPVARHRHQGERDAEQGHPQPGLREVGGLARSGHQPGQRSRAEFAGREQHHPDQQGQVGGLHAFDDRVPPPARTEQPGGTGGGPVGQERELSGDLGEHDSTHGQTGQRELSQVAYGRGVHQQVQRLSRQHPEGRHRQSRDLPWLGLTGRRFHGGRGTVLVHPGEAAVEW
jgi:hypothetical protein